MLVESFECLETSDESVEDFDAVSQLIEELNLDGQKEYLGKDKQRCPYRMIRKDESFVYQTLCPQETNLAEYKASPIPLRVLQIVAHAKSLDLFTNFWVWSQADSQEKDPVLVAGTGGQYEWNRGDIYILARWGEELETFDTLYKRAMKKFRESMVQMFEGLLAAAKGATDEVLINKGAKYRLTF